MNNSQFRSLLSSTPTSSNNPSNGASTPSSMRPPTLGSRARSSIPMTPRSVHGSSGIDFRRQLADLNSEPPTKKFKSSGPKGVKLAAGYVDRAKQSREGGEVQDDKEKRLQALEEMYKLQQIDGETLEKLRRELGVGGSAETTHLVKGLDFELLKRVRAGEDVLKEPAKMENEEMETEQEKADVDDELDNVLEHDIQAAGLESTKIQEDDIATPQLDTQVFSRNEILARLKASRVAGGSTQTHAPSKSPEPVLGDRFKKVGSDSKSEKKRFTEIVDGRRREVLLTTDKDGKSKRKVRWLDPPGTKVEAMAQLPAQEVLGMEIPAEIAAKQKALLEQQKVEEDEDDEIFAGVGADYDPLKDIESEEDGSDDEADPKAKSQTATATTKEVPNGPRNYFGSRSADDEKDQAHPTSGDPTILAALKRAAALRQVEASAETQRDDVEEELDPEKALKRKAFLEKLKQQQRDDARDMDMGFGESRFGDEDDEDGPIYNSGDEKKERRKRAPKKRKGDKDNVKDVLGVLEGRAKKP